MQVMASGTARGAKAGRPGAGLRCLAAPAAALMLLVSGCASGPPKDLSSACSIFKDKKSWYRAAKKSEKRWGLPPSILLAIVRQESGFVKDARPPRMRRWTCLWGLGGFLLFLCPRPSSARGFAQALDGTWAAYIRSSGNSGADRDNFKDASDFVGWYTHNSRRNLGIGRRNARALYLAYHEGDGGYRRGSYRSKPWLIKVAGRVQQNADRYERQLGYCRKRLDKRWWHLW